MNKPPKIERKFNEKSYNNHINWYDSLYPNYDQKLAKLKENQNYTESINHYLQQIFFNCLKPFTNDKNKTWLTLGDAYGYDAKYLLDCGIKQVIASDLNDVLLSISKEISLINDFRVENAEKLTLSDNSIDYLLCKESYHHFPRPYAALYEMIRVAKKGIIIIEPQDPISKMPFLLFLNNILEKTNPNFIYKIWKNKFSYEPVGNFVYKISQREMEKFAAGLNLPMIAVKSINPNFWFPGSNKIPAVKSEKKFRSILLKKKIRDFSTKIGLIPSQTLSVVIFKELPNIQLQNTLKKEKYRLINIPSNPYI